MSTMERRKLLASIASLGVAATAGCSDNSDDSEPEQKRVTEDTDEEPDEEDRTSNRPPDEMSSYEYWISPDEVDDALNSDNGFYYTSLNIDTLEASMESTEIDAEPSGGGPVPGFVNFATRQLYLRMTNHEEHGYSFIPHTDLPIGGSAEIHHNIEQLINIDDTNIFVGEIDPIAIIESTGIPVNDTRVESYGPFEIHSTDTGEEPAVFALSTRAFILPETRDADLSVSEQVGILEDRLDSLEDFTATDSIAGTENALTIAETPDHGMVTGAVNSVPSLRAGIPGDSMEVNEDAFEGFFDLTEPVAAYTMSGGFEFNRGEEETNEEDADEEDTSENHVNGDHIYHPSAAAFSFPSESETPSEAAFSDVLGTVRGGADERTITHLPPEIFTSGDWYTELN